MVFICTLYVDIFDQDVDCGAVVEIALDFYSNRFGIHTTSLISCSSQKYDLEYHK